MYRAVDVFSSDLETGDKVTQIMHAHIVCTETSVRNWHFTLRNMAEDRIFQGEMIIVVIIKLYSCTESFFFLKGTFQTSYKFMQSACPPATYIYLRPLCPLAP